MIWAIVITFLGITITGLVVWWVVRSMPPEPKMSRVQEMLGTKEGREELAKLQEGVYARPYPIRNPACKTCEGYGKLNPRWVRGDDNSPVFTSDKTICPDCEGTGFEGGLDYKNVECPQCEGAGASPNGACGFCNATGVVKVLKEKTGEKKNG